MMRAQCTRSGVRQSKREAAASRVHPESQAGLASLGHDVRIAVPIDIRDDNPDDEIICAETQPVARARQANRQQSRLAVDFNAIVYAVSIEIGPQRFGSGGGGNDEREDATERDRGASPDVRDSCAEEGVMFQGR